MEGALANRLSRPSDRKLLSSIKDRIGSYKDEIYACCFSSKRDSTVQWMTYADSGKGFAIGFDPNKLLAEYPDIATIEKLNSYFDGMRGLNEVNRLKLSPVIYFNRINRSKIMEVISERLEELNNKEHHDEWSQFRVAEATAWFDTVTKDDGFSHESEYRLMHTPEGLTLDQMLDLSRKEPVRGSVLDPLNWRASRYGLAPYYDFRFPADAITELWIGPRNPDHPNVSSKHMLGQFCARYGL